MVHYAKSSQGFSYDIMVTVTLPATSWLKIPESFSLHVHWWSRVLCLARGLQQDYAGIISSGNIYLVGTSPKFVAKVWKFLVKVSFPTLGGLKQNLLISGSKIKKQSIFQVQIITRCLVLVSNASICQWITNFFFCVTLSNT